MGRGGARRIKPAAFDSEFAKLQVQIDALRDDKSLSAHQRAAAIFALRERQQSGARKRVMVEEKQTAKAARRAACALTSPPAPPPECHSALGRCAALAARAANDRREARSVADRAARPRDREARADRRGQF